MSHKIISNITKSLESFFLSLSLSFLFFCARCIIIFFLLVVCFLFFIQCSFALDKRSPYKRSWITNCLSIPHQKPIQKTRNWSQNFLFYYSNLKRFSFYFFLFLLSQNTIKKSRTIISVFMLFIVVMCVCV